MIMFQIPWSSSLANGIHQKLIKALYLKQGPSIPGASYCMENERNSQVPNSLKQLSRENLFTSSQCTLLEAGAFNPRRSMLHGKFKKWLCFQSLRQHIKWNPPAVNLSTLLEAGAFNPRCLMLHGKCEK